MKRSTATLVFLLVVAFLAADNGDFLFHQPFSEIGDAAADSLCIIRAKHFAQLYGCYSRWGFHHPGPALFYVLGWGEGLLFDWLHLCPAPNNAQRLTQLCLGCSFLVMALRVFTRWLPQGPRRAWFLAGAPAFAAFHFADDRKVAFLGVWPAYPPVLLMVCLLTVGAAVAAGDGAELPSLVLAGGFLLHLHVAQPLFVVPLTLLAYTGLLWRCAAVSPEPTAKWRRQRWMRFAGAGWRAWPRAHLLSVGLLVIFVLPLLIDACRGADSNLAAIWHHMRSHRGERKTWIRSFLYFLQFGTYAYYGGKDQAGFGHYDRAGALAYLRSHALILACWLGVATTALWTVVREIPVFSNRSDYPVPTAEALRSSTSGSTRHFLAWTGAFLGVAITLTLYWGTIQDGALLYYNAFFNYGIYYFGALIALAVLCSQPWFALFSPQNRWLKMGTRLLPTIFAMAVCGWQAGSLRSSSVRTAEYHKNLVAITKALVPAVPDVPFTPRFVLFSDEDLPQAMGIAVQLRRLDTPFFMLEPYKLMVGEEHIFRSVAGDQLRAGLQRWRLHRVAAAGATSAPPAHTFPLAPPLFLSVDTPTIDPANPAGAAVIDYRSGGNASAYTLFGWSMQEPDGTWSDGHEGLLAFAPEPVAGGNIEVRVEASPLLHPGKGLSVQRLRAFFDGEALGEIRATDTSPTSATSLKFTIPAASWNRAAARQNTCATLGFEWPDARSPAELNPDVRNQDARRLGWMFRSLEFRVVPALDTVSSTRDASKFYPRSWNADDEGIAPFIARTSP